MAAAVLIDATVVRGTMEHPTADGTDGLPPQPATAVPARVSGRSRSRRLPAGGICVYQTGPASLCMIVIRGTGTGLAAGRAGGGPGILPAGPLGRFIVNPDREKP
jgi:hypothetical protein